MPKHRQAYSHVPKWARSSAFATSVAARGSIFGYKVEPVCWRSLHPPGSRPDRSQLGLVSRKLFWVEMAGVGVEGLRFLSTVGSLDIILGLKDPFGCMYVLVCMCIVEMLLRILWRPTWSLVCRSVESL